jgi:DNA mismatch repair ATPase MutS
VATHDLRLHRTGGLEDAARPVHFRGEVKERGDEGPALTFDYDLREGPATSTNALDLLRLVGLGPPDA